MANFMEVLNKISQSQTKYFKGLYFFSILESYLFDSFIDNRSFPIIFEKMIKVKNSNVKNIL